jgi:hypothetical protein
MINDNNSNLVNFHKISDSIRPEINNEVFKSLIQSSSSHTKIKHQISSKIKYNYKHDIKHKLNFSDCEHQLIKNYTNSLSGMEPMQLQPQSSYLNKYNLNPYKSGLKYQQSSPGRIELFQFHKQQLEYLKWARNLLHVQGHGLYAGLPLELRLNILDNVTSSCHLLSPSIRKAIVNYALDKATLPKRSETDSECRNAFFNVINNKNVELAEAKNWLNVQRQA